MRIPSMGIPEGARFKGYQEFVVQELEIIPKNITYKLEVWQLPDGTIVRSALPREVQGSHFGHQLRALVHNLYASDHLIHIYKAPGEFKTVIDAKTGLMWIEKRLPDGSGIRLNQNYTFKGFID